MLHMLDTDISSYLIKRRSPSIDARLEKLRPSEACVSVITQAELLFGLRRLPSSNALHRGVFQFLSAFRILPWDVGAAAFYADIKHDLIARGQPIGELDMMIAAHCLAMQAVLVTNNTRHFKRIAAPLILENWAE